MRAVNGVAGLVLSAMIAASAVAQQPPPEQPVGTPPPPPPQQPAGTPPPPPEQQAQQPKQPDLPASADQIIEKKVMSQTGQEVGQVDNVLVDDQGKVHALIISHGGTLGLGRKKMAVPWDKIKLSGDMVTINMSEQEVSQLPEYKGGQ